ncbi:MAG: hypothetical protein AB7K86_19260, partial [Rhodospirillales bacterium]
MAGAAGRRAGGFLIGCATVALTVAAAAGPPAEMPLPPLPSAVAAALKGPYAGWSIPTRVDAEGFDFCRRKPPAASPALRHPHLVSGDFDGDGRTDYAFYLTRPAKAGTAHQSAVALGDGRTVRLDGPDTLPVREAQYFLDVTPKDTKLTSVYSAKTVRTANDAIDL